MIEVLLIVFIGIKYDIQVSMRNKDFSRKEIVWLFSSELFNSLDMFLSELRAAEFDNKLIIVNFLVGRRTHCVRIYNKVFLLWVRSKLPSFAVGCCYSVGICCCSAGFYRSCSTFSCFVSYIKLCDYNQQIISFISKFNNPHLSTFYSKWKQKPTKFLFLVLLYIKIV